MLRLGYDCPLVPQKPTRGGPGRRGCHSHNQIPPKMTVLIHHPLRRLGAKAVLIEVLRALLRRPAGFVSVCVVGIFLRDPHVRREWVCKRQALRTE